MIDNEFIQKLQDLQYISAPVSLKKKMRGMVVGLPDKHSGFYFPLFTFRLAVVAAVLLVVLAASTGVLLAAKNSNQTEALYPVKLLIHRVAPKLIGDTEVQKKIVPTPTPSPLPTQTPKHKIHTQSETETDENTIRTDTPETKEDVKGIHDENKDKDDDKKKKDNFFNVPDEVHNTVQGVSNFLMGN